MKLLSNSRAFGGTAMVALLLAVGAATLAAQATHSDKIAELLSQAQIHAVLAEDDAAALENSSRSKLSWKSHSAKLHQIREHINDLGKVSKQLMDVRAEGSPWQQEAIDRIDPLLRDMASQLTATIQHFNDSPSSIHMKPYRDFARANHDAANKTAEVIKDFVEYDEAKSKSESLEKKLALPADDKGK